MPNGAAEPGLWRGSSNPKQLLEETTQGRVASLKTRGSDLMNDPQELRDTWKARTAQTQAEEQKTARTAQDVRR